MANDKDDGKSNSSDSWPWNASLNDLQAEHDRFLSELRDGEPQHSNNPFATFKRLVDENIRGIQSTLTSLLPSTTELRAQMQREMDQRRAEEQDISTRWTGSSDSPDHIRMEIARSTQQEKDEAHEATLLLLTEAYNKNAHIPPEKIEALFQDDQLFPGLWDPQWLSVNWFKTSPYSPIRIEARSELSESGKSWRAAFEDLMSAALDKPMTSTEYVGMREPHGKPQSTYKGPGLEWLLSMQCRGVLPPLFPVFHSYPESPRTRSSVLDAIRHSRPNLPWTHESISRYSDEQDICDLMAEVATKSTSDTYAQPLETRNPLPETEQDLYESPHIMPRPSYPGIKETCHRAQQKTTSAVGAVENAADADRRSTTSVLSSQNQAESEQDQQRRAEIFDEYSGNDEADATWLWMPIEMLEQAARELREKIAAEESEEWENLREMVGEKRQEATTPRKPDVLSALTTTRTTRLPDGTVTTEVVLKKRFSDGSETTEESVHTSNESLERQPNQSTEQQEEKPKNKGWFWTS